MKHIVKRAGHAETYDERKLYASIYSICLSVMVPVGTAEIVAKEVTADVNSWIKDKQEVTSNDIRAQATKSLKSYSLDAAYMYLHHRVLH